MSKHDEYLKKAEDLLGEICMDADVSDQELIDLCEEIACNFTSQAKAKKEELKAWAEDD